MTIEDVAERILKFIQAKGYEPKPVDELAVVMGIGAEESDDFRAACKTLATSKRVVLGTGSVLTLPPPTGKIIGTFRSHPRGFGFVIPEVPNAQGDLYVASGKTGGALSGDTVSVRVMKRGKRAGKMLYEGRVVSIIERGRNRFVGELRREHGRWHVVPDGNAIHVPIFVGDPGAKGAKPGDQVAFELTQYPEAEVEARGVIVRVLGKRGEPGVETLSIIEQHQLPGAFPDAVLAESRERATAYNPRRAVVGREDLRKLTVITIDPEDARDFDDAISLTELSDGRVELGVHIADVAHFVTLGSDVDVEARKRSTSIYLPGTVIPMLPETLSNGVCSLQEGQIRLTKSAFITYDAKARVQSARLANTVIRSTKRLTYQQAGAILEGKAGRIGAEVVTLVERMERLAKAIRSRRLKAGMLELDLPDVELVFDGEGRVIDVEPEDMGFSHKIIEMFMVEANEAVSRKLAEQGVPHLRRIHGEPRDLLGGSLQSFLLALGHKLREGAHRKALQSLLADVYGEDDAFAVNLAILRSMQRAEYAPTTIGHYALASEHYCHFTSPIRRYPDLTIHRLIDQYIAGRFENGQSGVDWPDEEALTELGKLCTEKEQRAEEAERELKLVLVLRLLLDKLGDEFEGIVTGVTNIGVFVQLDRYLVDGLLRFERLADDWWEVDSGSGRATAERSGHTIAVGDRLTVVISRISLPARKMDLALAQPLTGATKGRQRKGSGKIIQRRAQGRKASGRKKRPAPSSRRRR